MFVKYIVFEQSTKLVALLLQEQKVEQKVELEKQKEQMEQKEQKKQREQKEQQKKQKTM